MARNREALIKALRCTATPHSECDPECPYRQLEEITPKLKEELGIEPDVIVNGKGYWISCDGDRICLDAAEELENA